MSKIAPVTAASCSSISILIVDLVVSLVVMIGTIVPYFWNSTLKEALTLELVMKTQVFAISINVFSYKNSLSDGVKLLKRVNSLESESNSLLWPEHVFRSNKLIEFIRFEISKGETGFFQS
jgi:hypothetical protein